MTIALLLLPINVKAASGCCSGHGGVDCSRQTSDGRVVCNDGYTGSSCSYNSMVKCGGSRDYNYSNNIATTTTEEQTTTTTTIPTTTTCLEETTTKASDSDSSTDSAVGTVTILGGTAAGIAALVKKYKK